MAKIDDENLSSESIETHLKKIRALLSGENNKEKQQVEDEKPGEDIKEEEPVTQQETENSDEKTIEQA